MIKELMAQSPLFKNFDELALDQLEKLAVQVEFPAHSTIFTKGEDADPIFYMVFEGAVSVMLESGEVYATYGAAGIIGEIGPISHSKKRMRRVIAAEQSTLLKWNLDDLDAQYPELNEKVIKAMKELAWERANPVVRQVAGKTET
ncbi:cyclic nucleotide-binding domain-containing protein [Pseudomonadota bacterium]